MKTAQEFVNSVYGLASQVYVLGEQVADPATHPILRPSLNALAMTYQLVHDDSALALMQARSSLDGRAINCFTSIHTSLSTSQNWHGRGFPSLDKRDYQSIL
jgi:4-hydroxybutyryl-CoA dehydratase/vinylacetyl-CoA-Delta-isomerase